MRIVIIGPAPPLRGGIAQHTAGVAEAFALADWDVNVLGYTRQYPSLLFPGRTQYEGTRTLGETVLDVLGPASWRKTLDRVVRWEPDRVVAEWWHPIAAPALSWVLSRVHGRVRTLICHNAVPHEWFPGALLALRGVLAHVDEVLCHSEHVAGLVREASGNVPIRVTPMPLLPRNDDASYQDAGDTKANSSVCKILFIGHIRSYKGLDGLIEAWALRDRRRPAFLSIVGERYRGVGRSTNIAIGRYGDLAWDDRYLSDAAMLGAVVSADVVVMPYSSASQSGLLPVACALGTAVIATDVGGLREQGDSAAGVSWVPPKDAGRLAVAIDRAIRRERRSAASRREAWAGYGAARTASWVEFRRALIGGAASAPASPGARGQTSRVE